MEFKIPYYVGPLNPYHKDTSGHAWIEKKSNEKILPWNFEEVVDTTKTAEKFIIRMTNKCTYLLGEDVLPKSSLLYQKFMLLNELNNMKIRGDYIAKGLKDEFIEGLFKKKSRVSIKDLCNYYEYKYQVKLDKKDISGLDITFKSNLSSNETDKGNDLFSEGSFEIPSLQEDEYEEVESFDEVDSDEFLSAEDNSDFVVSDNDTGEPVSFLSLFSDLE